MRKGIAIAVLVGFLTVGYCLHDFFSGPELHAENTTFKQAATIGQVPAQSVDNTLLAYADKSGKAGSSSGAAGNAAAPASNPWDMLPNISLENLPIFLDVMSAVLELSKEDPKIKEDLSKITYALGYGMTAPQNPDRHNAWDTRVMTDWERVLYCLEDILNPQNKEKFKALTLKVMKAGEALEGSDLMYGATYSLGSLYRYRNPKTNAIMDLNEVDYALYHVMMQLNENFKPRDKDTIRVSELHSTLLLVDALSRMVAPLKGVPAKAALSLISLDPKGPDVKTRSDALEFLGGLMGKSMYYYPRSYHNTFQIGAQEYRPYPDPLKGVDWFFYEQKLTLAGVLPMKGVNGMLYLLKNFAVADYVIGVVSENLDALYVVSGSTGKPRTTGQRHRLLTVAAPTLNYVYDKGYTPQVMKILSALNEVPLTSYKSLAWNKDKGTLRQAHLGTALEVIEGPYGYGLPYYLLRGASDQRYNNEADVLDPTLDLMVRITHKLATTPYGKSNLLRALFNELDRMDLGRAVTITKEEIVNKAYAPNGPTDKAYRVLHENHAQLAKLGTGIGNVMMSAANQKDKEKNIFYTADLTTLLQKSIFPALSRELKANNDVAKALINNLRKMPEQ